MSVTQRINFVMPARLSISPGDKPSQAFSCALQAHLLHFLLPTYFRDQRPHAMRKCQWQAAQGQLNHESLSISPRNG